MLCMCASSDMITMDGLDHDLDLCFQGHAGEAEPREQLVVVTTV